MTERFYVAALFALSGFLFVGAICGALWWETI